MCYVNFIAMVTHYFSPVPPALSVYLEQPSSQTSSDFFFLTPPANISECNIKRIKMAGKQRIQRSQVHTLQQAACHVIDSTHDEQCGTQTPTCIIHKRCILYSIQ